MKAKVLTGILTIAILSLVASPLAFAQIPDLTETGGPALPSTTGTYDFGDLISTANTTVNIFVSIIVIASILLMVWGGFTFITSGGDTGKVQEAKNRVVYGLVGIGVMLLAVSVFNIVGSFLQ